VRLAADDATRGDVPADRGEPRGDAEAALEQDDAVEGHLGPEAGGEVRRRRQVREVSLHRLARPLERRLVPLAVESTGERHALVEDDEKVDLGAGDRLAPCPGTVGHHTAEVRAEQRRGPGDRCAGGSGGRGGARRQRELAGAVVVQRHARVAGRGPQGAVQPRLDPEDEAPGGRHLSGSRTAHGITHRRTDIST
jgi:hypothetical protein